MGEACPSPYPQLSDSARHWTRIAAPTSGNYPLDGMNQMEASWRWNPNLCQKDATDISMSVGPFGSPEVWSCRSFSGRVINRDTPIGQQLYETLNQ